MIEQLFLNINIFKIFGVDQRFLKGIPLKEKSSKITSIVLAHHTFKARFMSTSCSSYLIPSVLLLQQQ